MLYVDTSVIVAALVREAATAAAQEWLAARDAGLLCISDWTITETSSALAIKLRSGHMRLADRASALATFKRLAAESFTVLPVTSGDFRSAATYVDQHALGLRAGDALHLAVAARHGAEVCTFDRRLAEAGPPLGIPARLLG